jgi:hypothetical protein
MIESHLLRDILELGQSTYDSRADSQRAHGPAVGGRLRSGGRRLRLEQMSIFPPE